MITAITGAIVSSMGFGTANVVIKKSLSSLSFAQTLTMSTLSGAVSLVLLILVAGSTEDINARMLLTALGLAMIEVSLYLLLYKTFSVSNVTIATAILNTFPVISLAITVLFFAEKVRPTQLLFVPLMIVGAIVVSINWGDAFKDGFGKNDLVKGLGWIIIITIVHAVYFPLVGEFTSTGSWEIKLLLIKMFSTLIVFIVFLLIRRENIIPPIKKIPFTSLLGILEVVGWVGFSWATNNTENQTGIILVAMNSAALVTAILAYLFLGEKLSKIQYLGIIIIIAGLTGLSM